MEQKIVLDTNIVKDLIQYHKDKQYKVNNGIDIKKVYDYITNMKYDGISKCYVTIYSEYEVLKDFTEENFNENFNIFKTVLYPQTITSKYARQYIDDYKLVNLDEKDKQYQDEVLEEMRNLIVDLYTNTFSDIFIAIPLSFIGILEISIKNKTEYRKKVIQKNIENIYKIIKNKLKNDLYKSIAISKHEIVKCLNNHYIKISLEHYNLLYKVFSIYHIPVTSDYIQTDFDSDKEYLDFLNMLKNRSAYNFYTDVNERDTILTLSSCYGTNERVVVHAKLIQKQGK